MDYYNKSDNGNGNNQNLSEETSQKALDKVKDKGKQTANKAKNEVKKRTTDKLKKKIKEKTTDKLKSAAKKQAKKVTKPIKDTVKKGMKKLSQAMKKIAKQIAKVLFKVAKAVAKLVVKAILTMAKAIIELIIALFPWSVIVILVIALICGVIYLFDSSPSTESYQTKTIEQDNDITFDSNGYPVAENLSEYNKLTLAFYTYFSYNSYYCLIDDDKTVYKAGDEYLKTNSIVDKYKREQYFRIPVGTLYALDNQLNDGDYVYPEQFVKPVYYDKDSYELLDLVDKHGAVVAKSTGYDKSGYKDENVKTKGIWDYGFGSVLHYKSFNEYELVKGSITSKQVWDSSTNSIKVDTTGDKNDKYKKKTDLGKVHLIDWVISPTGKVSNQISFEELPSGPSYEIKQVYDVHIEYTMASLTKKEKKKMSSSEIASYNAERESSAIRTPLTKTYTVINYKKCAVYEGEPDLSKLVGCKYYKDYFSHYETYMPKSVATEIDFNGRTGETDTALLQLLADDTQGSYVTVGDNAESIVTASSPLDIGSSKGSQSVKNALRYLSYFQKYGEMYGVDPYLLVAKAAQESGGDHDGHLSGGAAVGICQIEGGSHSTTRTAYNQLTGKQETVTLDVFNVEENIHAGAMMFSNSVNTVKGNVLMAIQGYNYNANTVKLAVEAYAKANGKTLEQVQSDVSDTGWLSYVADLHQNPSKYGVTGYTGECNMSTCPYYHKLHPSGEKYGDPGYVSNVIRYYSDPSNGSPWVKTSNGTVYALGDLSGVQVGTETLTSAKSTKKSKGFLDSLFGQVESLIASFPDLFPSSAVDYDSEPHSHYENKMINTFHQDTLLATILAMENGLFISDYNNITDEYWIEKYSYLFSNSVMSDSTSLSVYDSQALSYFPNGFTKPLDTLTVVKSYGVQADSTVHSGVDFSATEGTKVYAVDDGTVTDVVENDSTYGTIITITHSNGMITKYANLKKSNVVKGASIKKGATIGTTGKYEKYSGGTTLTGLHFELISESGTNVDCTFIYKNDGNNTAPPKIEGASALGQKIYDTAVLYSGGTYVWGGGHGHERNNSKGGNFDCSGFVSTVIYNALGISFYDTVAGNDTSSIYSYAQKNDKKTCDIFGDKNQLQTGDIILGFNDNNGQRGDTRHVMIFVKWLSNGNMKVIEAQDEGLPIKEYEKQLSYLTKRHCLYIRFRP